MDLFLAHGLEDLLDRGGVGDGDDLTLAERVADLAELETGPERHDEEKDLSMFAQRENNSGALKCKRESVQPGGYLHSYLGTRLGVESGVGSRGNRMGGSKRE